MYAARGFLGRRRAAKILKRRKRRRDATRLARLVQRIWRGVLGRRRAAELRAHSYRCRCGATEPGGRYCKRCGAPKVPRRRAEPAVAERVVSAYGRKGLPPIDADGPRRRAPPARTRTRNPKPARARGDENANITYLPAKAPRKRRPRNPAPRVPHAIRDAEFHWQDAAGSQRGPSTFAEYRRAIVEKETHRRCLVYAAGVTPDDAWKLLEELPELLDWTAASPKKRDQTGDRQVRFSETMIRSASASDGALPRVRAPLGDAKSPVRGRVRPRNG